MFTGIIEALGVIKRNSANEIAIEAALFSDAKVGESICVNGTCLTIAELRGKVASFDISAETMKRTNLETLKVADKVNLERALKVGERLGGHFVIGHVDCVGKIANSKSQMANGKEVEIEVPSEVMKYIVEKGSVAVDGVSLTVGEVKERSFVVHLVPHTLKMTTLGIKGEGDAVNIEVDILGKYVEKFSQQGQRITQDFLREHGFI